MCRCLIFLNNCAGSLFFTYLCKRKQFWDKNLLLISPPVNTSLSFLSHKFPVLLIPLPFRLLARQISQTYFSHPRCKLLFLLLLRLELAVKLLKDKYRICLFLLSLWNPAMTRTFLIIGKGAPEHKLYCPLPSLSNTAAEKPLI
ncbi:Uncharacterized protein HZ326_28084 [Fusarium oxysporum f. sp. albedinis]|nr:Uncharacterized protein HZ326_28084 [Fusarium oxysporum f. sp. albedinis]